MQLIGDVKDKTAVIFDDELIPRERFRTPLSFGGCRRARNLRRGDPSTAKRTRD